MLAGHEKCIYTWPLRHACTYEPLLQHGAIAVIEHVFAARNSATWIGAIVGAMAMRCLLLIVVQGAAVGWNVTAAGICPVGRCVAFEWQKETRILRVCDDFAD